MEWIVDDAEKALVAKECLVAGIDLDAKKIQEFLDNMLKELTALEKEEQLEVDKRDARIKELKILKSISEEIKELQEIRGFLGESLDTVELPSTDDEKEVMQLIKKNTVS